MKPSTIYKILRTLTLLLALAIIICLFSDPDIGYWFAIPFAICLFATIFAKIYVIAEKENTTKNSHAYTLLSIIQPQHIIQQLTKLT